MEVVIALVVLLAPALAWLAYNHPRQYRYVACVGIGAYINFLFLGHWVIRYRDSQLALVKKSGIPPEYIDIIVKTLTDTNGVDEPWFKVFYFCFQAFPFYLVVLLFFPEIGLTAEAKEAAAREAVRREYVDQSLSASISPRGLPPKEPRRGPKG